MRSLVTGKRTMKQFITMTGALALTTTLAQAGGVERAATNIGFMFEKGNYAELSFGSASPTVSGKQLVTAGAGSPAGVSSGDMTNSFSTFSLAVKTQLSDKLSMGVLMDQPIGADVAYAPLTGYLYGGVTGSEATIKASAVTALLKLKLNDNFSVYGGPKIESVKGNVKLFNGYSMSTSNETDTGYLIGAAYEKPEIAMRVALTYASEITHDFKANEVVPGMGSFNTTFATEIPKSLTLDFQSGVAKDTLVFGSIRWREWTKFNISPALYTAGAGSPLVDYNSNVITYNLGIGRKFNDTWSGAITIGHEKKDGGFQGNLGPTDGYTSIGLGGTYTKGNMKISGGVTYAWIGDAKTAAPKPFPAGTSFGDFKDNHLVGIGVKVGFTF